MPLVTCLADLVLAIPHAPLVVLDVDLEVVGAILAKFATADVSFDEGYLNLCGDSIFSILDGTTQRINLFNVSLTVL